MTDGSVRGPLKRACADAGHPQAPGIEARHKHRADPDREPVEAGDVPAAAPVHGPAVVLESAQVVAALMPSLPPAPTEPTPASRVVGAEPRAEFRLATRGPAPWVAPSTGAPADEFVLTGAGLHEARTALLQEFNPAIVAAQEEGTGAHLVGLILAVASGAHDETVLDAAASAAALLAVAGSPLLQEAGGLEMCTLAVSRGALQGCTPAAVAALLQDLLRVTEVAAPAMAFRPLWAELQVLQPAACRPIPAPRAAGPPPRGAWQRPCPSQRGRSRGGARPSRRSAPRAGPARAGPQPGGVGRRARCTPGPARSLLPHPGPSLPLSGWRGGC